MSPPLIAIIAFALLASCCETLAGEAVRSARTGEPFELCCTHARPDRLRGCVCWEDGR